MTVTARLWLLVLALGLVVPATAEPPPLIPRELLVGSPTEIGYQVSPDGTRLAYLAPSADDVLKVWVQPIGAARPGR